MNYLKTLKDMTKNNKIYIVGGTIRNYLLNKNVNDIDMIVFNGIKDLVYKFAKEINKKVIVLDKNRNVFRVVINENLFLDFSSPVGQDLFEDLGYRDFTINSMAVEINDIELNNNQIHIKEKDIVDPFSGKDDIDKKMIKLVKNTAIENDPLRIIRAFRFANNLNFEINSKTKNIIENNISLINRVKVERIKEELIKYFNHNLNTEVLREFLDTNILNILFEIDYNENINSNNISNTIYCIKNVNYFKKMYNKKYIVILIVIFIELIKHNDLDIKVIEETLITYTFKKNDVIIIRDYLYVIDHLLNNHNKYINNDELLYDKLFIDNLNYNEISYIINCYHKNKSDLSDINEIIKTLNLMENRTKKININGNLIMNILDIKPGKRVGEILKRIKKKISLGVLNNKKEIIDYIESISKNRNNQ